MFDKSGMTPPQGHNVTLGSKEALNDSGRLNWCSNEHVKPSNWAKYLDVSEKKCLWAYKYCIYFQLVWNLTLLGLHIFISYEYGFKRSSNDVLGRPHSTSINRGNFRVGGRPPWFFGPGASLPPTETLRAKYAKKVLLEIWMMANHTTTVQILGFLFCFLFFLFWG